MFQPQPTPFASGSSYYLASSSHTSGFPSSSTPDPPTAPHANSAFAQPPSFSQSSYGIASSIPFGHYFPPQPVGGEAGAGAGTRTGTRAGVGTQAEARAGSQIVSEPGFVSGSGSGAGIGAGLTAGGGPRTGSATASRRAVAAHTLPSAASTRELTCSPFLPNSSLPTPSSAQQGRHRHPQQHSQRRLGSPSPRNPLPKMEDQQDPHGIAAQQAAAKDYEPDLPNYLVGARIPSSAIIAEYAKADQTYIQKTVALPAQYSHYRPIQGDGNCGWRAIGFSYFEKLVEIGDPNLFNSEINRLNGMSPLLERVGGYGYFEDWVEAFIDALHEVRNSLGNPAMAHELVFQKWNDKDATNAMIYYLRLLTGTYLKDNVEKYDPFIADSGGVHAYCQQSVEPLNHEIEHLGVVALANVLLKPANFVLEIAYLDRSAGNQVNTYRFPDEANNQDASALGPMIHLLYRPTHYDILYRSPPASSLAGPLQQPVNLQVHRVGNFTDNACIASTQNDLGAFSTVNFDALSFIPGAFGGSMPLSNPGTDPFQPAQQPQDHWAQNFALAPSPQPTPPQSSVTATGPPANPSLSPHIDMHARSSAPGMGPSQPGMAAGTSLAPSPECTIRFSPMQLEYDGGKGGYAEPTFHVQTNTFKNSVWNRAHFGNPDFHPEEWTPEDESADGRIGSKRRGSKRDY